MGSSQRVKGKWEHSPALKRDADHLKRLKGDEKAFRRNKETVAILKGGERGGG